MVRTITTSASSASTITLTPVSYTHLDVYKRQSVGRVIVNQIIPEEVGFFNDVISKKTLRGLISDVIKAVGMALSLIHISS